MARCFFYLLLCLFAPTFIRADESKPPPPPPPPPPPRAHRGGGSGSGSESLTHALEVEERVVAAAHAAAEKKRLAKARATTFGTGERVGDGGNQGGRDFAKWLEGGELTGTNP